MSQGRGAKEQRGKGATSPLLPRSPAPSLPCSLAPALPYLALLGGMTCMAVAAIVVKWANAPGLVSGFYRMAIAVGIFALPFAREATRHPSASLRTGSLRVPSCSPQSRARSSRVMSPSFTHRSSSLRSRTRLSLATHHPSGSVSAR